MPGPSSSITRRSRRPAGVSAPQACTCTALRAHLQALSIRLPATSCRSCTSPAKCRSSATAAQLMRTPRSACTRSSTRTSPASAGATAARTPGRPCAAAARARARCQSTWRRATPTWSCTWAARAPASAGWRCAAAAACASAASGVFTAWARLPACVRARSTIAALWSSTRLKSSTSGCTSAGKRVSMRCARPACTAASDRCSARSGARPTATCATAAAPSSSSSAPSEAASMPVKRWIASAVSPRSAATIRRQGGAAWPGGCTVRSTSSKGAPCGPGTSCTCTSPGRGASAGGCSVVSHSDRERSTAAAGVAPARSICQYRPEYGRDQRGSLSCAPPSCGWPVPSNSSRAVTWSSWSVSVRPNWRSTWSRNSPDSSRPASASATSTASSVAASSRNRSDRCLRAPAILVSPVPPAGSPCRARSRWCPAAACDAGVRRRPRWCWSRGRSPGRTGVR